VTDLRLQEGRIFARFVAMSMGRTNGVAYLICDNEELMLKNVATAAILVTIGSNESEVELTGL
jgi:hypothetical protein